MAVTSDSADATSSIDIPKCIATEAAANAFITLCGPQMPRVTSACSPSPLSKMKLGWSNSSQCTCCALIAGLPSLFCGSPNHITSPGAMALIAATCSSFAFSTERPPGTRPRMISDLACAMRSGEPNSPRCATPTFNTTAISGGTSDVKFAISPT